MAEDLRGAVIAGQAGGAGRKLVGSINRMSCRRAQKAQAQPCTLDDPGLISTCQSVVPSHMGALHQGGISMLSGESSGKRTNGRGTGLCDVHWVRGYTNARVNQTTPGSSNKSVPTSKHPICE